jgi:glutamine cyclotransferase
MSVEQLSKGLRGELSRGLLILMAFIGLVSCGDQKGEVVKEGNKPPEPRSLQYELVETLPHDANAFTQGLLWHEGFFYESTGGYGRSSVRKVDPKTGKVLQIRNLARDAFGEGLVLKDDLLYQLEWKSGQGFIYQRENLELAGRFNYVGEGWGLAWDGTNFIVSDGTVYLRFFDPKTFELVRSIRVRDDRGRIDQLNELEFVEGKIYANRWYSKEILVIDPETGFVEATVDLKGLKGSQLPDPDAVLNGIAYDPKTKLFYVTGKRWPHLYAIRILE